MNIALIWLDDQYDDPDTPNRRPPGEGWIPCKTALQAIRLLRKSETTGPRIIGVSLDHDLGDRVIGNGYTVARYIERETLMGRMGRISIQVHSANPVGRDRILSAAKSCENYWKMCEVQAQ